MKCLSFDRHLSFYTQYINIQIIYVALGHLYLKEA